MQVYPAEHMLQVKRKDEEVTGTHRESVSRIQLRKERTNGRPAEEGQRTSEEILLTKEEA